MVVRLPETVRTDVAGMSSLLIPVPANAAQGANQIGFIPLSQVANLDLQLGPNQISRENGKRLVIVSANVRGRDLGSFVEEATASLDQKVQILRATGRLGVASSSSCSRLPNGCRSLFQSPCCWS